MQRVYFTYRTGSLGAAEQHVAALDPRNGSIVLDRDITGDLSVKVNSVGEDINGLKQRVSLLLENGILYVAFGAHDEESKPYRGSLLALDSATLHTIGQFKTAPDGQYGGGIWMSSSGIAADEDQLVGEADFEIKRSTALLNERWRLIAERKRLCGEFRVRRAGEQCFPEPDERLVQSPYTADPG